MKGRLYKWFYPVELVIIVYLIITGILIILFHSGLKNVGPHLFFRVLVLSILTTLAILHQRITSDKTIEFIRLFLPFVLISYLYKETDYLNNLIISENLDPYFSQLEEWLFGLQPAFIFSKAIHFNFFAELMYFGYFSYYLLLIGIPLYFYLKGDLKSTEKIIFILINSFLIFYLIFICLPVAGPQFYFIEWVSIPKGYIFGPIMRIIQHNGEAPTAAFPSSHVSICLMILIFSYNSGVKLLWLVVPIAFLLILSTVYIRAHYVIDVIVAIIVTPLIYYVSDKFYKKLSYVLNTGESV